MLDSRIPALMRGEVLTDLAGHSSRDDDDLSAGEGELESIVVARVASHDGGGVDVRDVGRDSLDDGHDIVEGELRNNGGLESVGVSSDPDGSDGRDAPA